MFGKVSIIGSSAVAIILAVTGSAVAATSPGQGASLRNTAEIAAAAPLRCSPHSGRKLTWYGGPVGAGDVQLVFWGSWWKHHGRAVRTELRKLYSDLGGSSWARTLTQYCDSHGHSPISRDLLGIGPVVIDSKNPPAHPTNDQLKAEARKWSPDFYGSVWGDEVIVTPDKVVPAKDEAVNGCGQHGWFVSPGPYDYVMTWEDIPVGQIIKTAGCGFHRSVISTVSIVAGHEWAEAFSDPDINSKKFGSGWATKGGSHQFEVGDLCSPHRSLKNIFTLKLSTGSFAMQKLWSNAARNCVKGS